MIDDFFLFNSFMIASASLPHNWSRLLPNLLYAYSKWSIHFFVHFYRYVRITFASQAYSRYRVTHLKPEGVLINIIALLLRRVITSWMVGSWPKPILFRLSGWPRDISSAWRRLYSSIWAWSCSTWPMGETRWTGIYLPAAHGIGRSSTDEIALKVASPRAIVTNNSA